VQKQLLAVLVIVAGSGPAFGQYQFTRIADYPVQPFQFLQNPPIDGKGRIVFMRPDNRTAQGVSGLLLSRMPAAPLTLVADEFADARTHSLNDQGYVTYVQEAVFMTDGVYTIEVAEAPDDPETEYHSPVINQRGTVAFEADADKDGNTALYLRLPGGEPEVFSDGMAGPLDFHSPPALDDTDHVVFSAYSFDTMTTDVYFFDGVDISLIYADGTSPIVSRMGRVAFSRLTPGNGSSAVLRGDEAGSFPLIVITSSGGTFTHVLCDDVNDSGLVLFRGSFSNGDIALYVGDGTTVTQIVRSGDVVLGRTVSNLSRGSLNNKGQIAFEAAFTDGSASVIRATPTPSPGVVN